MPLAQRDRVLDAVPRGLGEPQAAQQLRVGVVEAAHEPQRHAEADRELHGHVALRRLRARLLERGLDQRQRGGSVAAIDLELGQELAGELGLAPRARMVRQLERVAVELLGLVPLAAAAREHAERELRAGLARFVRDLARDAQRLAEVLLGQLPLPEAIADEAQVLVVRAHAAEEALALVDLESLLEEPGRLAPLAQVLVHEAEHVERTDQALGVLDAPERGGGVLQPVDGVLRAARARDREPERERRTRHGAVVVGVAQLRVRVERVAAGTTGHAQFHEQERDRRGRAGAQAVARESTRRFTCPLRLGQRLLEPAAHALGIRDVQHQPNAILDRVTARFVQRAAIRLERIGVRISRKVKVADRLLLRDPRRAGSRGSGIRGDRSLHCPNPRIRHKPGGLHRRFDPMRPSFIENRRP